MSIQSNSIHKKHPGIFNDVLSPITPGPSSSNTCGPFRIAVLCRQLLAEKPVSFSMTMAESGGYADTFFSMQSDLGTIAGLLGKDLFTYNLENSYPDAEKDNLHLSFDFSSTIPTYPSEMGEILISGQTHTLTLTAVSWGGGEIEITALNGHPVSLDGKSYTLVTFSHDGTPHCTTEGITKENAEKKAKDAMTDQAVFRTAILSPVFPFACKEIPTPPFSNAVELVQLAEESGLPLWELALDYEKSIVKASDDQLWAYAKTIYQIAVDSIQYGKNPGLSFSGVTTPKTPQYMSALKQGNLIPLGTADTGCLDALSIMEFSNSHGKIICMPTCGASGIVPAAILNTAKSLGFSHRKQIEALLVAGLFGLFYYPTHYSGSIGCQAEIGVAISMAAAALTSMLTDCPKTVEKAASLGGQSVLGLVCNPIDGYVQVPCILRNMTAVPTAITCANAALGGLDSILPLDTVVDLMLEVGKNIKPCNRAGTFYTDAFKPKK